jgi:formylglycine-generating enzyme required for sulfatase activity
VNKPIQDLLPPANAAINPTEFSAPNAEKSARQFNFTLAHLALGVVGLISVLLVSFISLASSVEVRAIERNLNKPEKFVALSADISFGSLIKLPLGNRVLLLSGAHEISVAADGYEPISRLLEVGGDANQSFELELVRLPGSLDITLEASNGELVTELAVVSIDGLERGLAPTLIDNVTAGNHEFTIDAPLYRPTTQSLLIKGKGETQSLNLVLEPAWAEVVINSEPVGANVLLDGESKGVTPLTLKIEEGSHVLAIQADKFKPYERTIGVVTGENLVFPSVQLVPADGVLKLNSSPIGAAVILNNEFRGNTPMTLALAPDTLQKLQLYKAGYKIEHKEISLKAASIVDQSIKLNSDIIAVKVSVSPNDATVFVDGRAQAKGTQTLKLTTLPHRISVRKNGYVTQTTDIIPTRANKQIISVSLLTKEQHYWAQVPNKYTTRFGHELILFKDLGKVSMGSSRREDGRRANEKTYEARLDKPFYVATTETTNRQFRAYKSLHNSGNYKAKSLDAQKAPVANVSWQDAARYCNWLSKKEGLDLFYQTTKGFVSGHNRDANGYRLLSEVEWSWLARNKGDDVLVYPWGKGKAPTAKVGNYADRKASSILTFIVEDYDDGYKGPAPVGRFAPNHRGLYDLDGNVSEWMHDWYSSSGNSELKGSAQLVDPLGPDIGEFHVVRGGSWAKGYLPQLRLAYRDYAAKGKHDIGFRIARYAGLNRDQQ